MKKIILAISLLLHFVCADAQIYTDEKGFIKFATPNLMYPSLAETDSAILAKVSPFVASKSTGYVSNPLAVGYYTPNTSGNVSNLPANTTQYQTFDGNYQTNLVLPTAVGRADGLSIYDNNASGFPVTVTTANTNLPANRVLIMGESLHFRAVGGVWQWQPTPFAVSPADWSSNAASVWNSVLTKNVGIGTTLPSSKLHVDGSVTFGQNTTATVTNQTANFAFTVAQINATSVVKAIQSTAGITYTIPNPTGSIGRILIFENAKESTAQITVVFGTSSKVVNPNTHLFLVWNGTEWSCNSENIGGNIIAMVKNVVPTTVLTWENYRLAFPSGAAARLATVSGTKSIALLTEQEYPGGSFATDKGASGTPITLTTTFQVVDDGVNVAGERYEMSIMDFTSNKLYKITCWRHSATSGNWSAWVSEIGITNNQILSAGNGIALTAGVISNPNLVTKKSALATAQAGTQADLGELTFRYSANATGGNLEVRSSSSSTVSIYRTGFERYPASRVGDQAGSNEGVLTLNANTGAFTPIVGGGAGINESLHYRITTSTNTYIVDIVNYTDTQIHMKVEKWF